MTRRWNCHSHLEVCRAIDRQPYQGKNDRTNATLHHIDTNTTSFSSQTVPTGVSYQITDRRLSNVKWYVGTITISPAKIKDKLQITYSYIFCIFIVWKSGLLGQIGILTVALDSSQTVSRNHVTHAAFWTVAPMVTPQGNTRRGLGEAVKFLFK